MNATVLSCAFLLATVPHATGQRWQAYSLAESGRVAIVTAANRAVQAHMTSEGKQPQGDDINHEFWGDAISQLEPVRVYDDRVNVAIVLRSDAEGEEGLYVSIPISSYAPQAGDGFTVFEMLSKPEDKAFGSLYYYKTDRRPPPATKAKSQEVTSPAPPQGCIPSECFRRPPMQSECVPRRAKLWRRRHGS